MEADKAHGFFSPNVTHRRREFRHIAFHRMAQGIDGRIDGNRLRYAFRKGRVGKGIDRENQRRIDGLLGPGMNVGEDADFGHFAPRSGCRRHGHDGQRLFIRPLEKLFIIEIIRAEKGNGLSGIHG